MTECQFCSSLQMYKQSARFWKKYDGDNLLHEYTVALVVRSWTKEKGKQRAGRTTDYRRQGIGFKLNYCPECGKLLRRKRERSDVKGEGDGET